MSTPYKAWAASGLTVRTDNPTLSPLVLCETPPPTAAILAIEAEELQAGWPQAIVDRANDIRRAPHTLWASASGISIGRVPAPEVLGHRDALSWALLSSSDAYSQWGTTFGTGGPAAPLHPTNIYEQSMAMGGLGRAAPFTTGSLRQALSWLTKREITSGTMFHFAGSGTATWQASLPTIRAEVAAGNICLGVEYFEGSGGAFSQSLYMLSLPRPAGWEGIGCLLYTFNYRGSWISNSNILHGAIPSLSFVAAEDVWRPILDELTSRPLTVVDLATATEDQQRLAYTGGVRDFVFARIPADTPVVPGTAWASENAGGNGPRGLARKTVYAMGRPEWMDSVHIIGDVVPTTGSLQINNAVASLEWAGELVIELAQADSSITPAQKANLAGLRIRTVIHPRQVLVPKELIKSLEIQQQALAAGEDLSNKKMLQRVVDENGTVTEEALTFAQAEKIAAGANATMVHQLLSFSQQGLPYSSVIITGSAGALTYSVKGPGNVAVTPLPEPDDVVDALHSGVRVVNQASGVTTDDALDELFGVSLTSLLGATMTTDASSDFDEANLFGPAAPNAELLNESQKAAFYLMQMARPRKHLSSVAVASMTQARVAYRRVK